MKNSYLLSRITKQYKGTKVAHQLLQRIDLFNECVSIFNIT
jgi:hypothetical protein